MNWFYLIKNKLNWGDFVEIIILLFVFAYHVVPILRIINFISIINISFIILWMAIVFFRKELEFIKEEKKYYYSLFFILYIIIFPILVGTPLYAHRYSSMLLFYISPIIYQRYKKYKNGIILDLLIIGVLLFSLLTFISTAKALMINPYISRSIKSSGLYTQQLLQQNIGGYEYIYYICLMSVIFILCFFISEKHKIIFLVLWLLSLSFLILSNYFTALVLVLISSIITFAIFSNNKNKLLYLIGGLIILQEAYYFRDFIFKNFLDFVAFLSPNGKTYYRLSMMEGSIIYGLFDMFSSNRYYTLEQSFETICKYPLLGMCIDKSSIVDNRILNIGQHSYVLDTFAIFGLVIGMLNCYLLIVNIVKSGIKYPYYISYLLCFAGVLFFNNATPSLAICTYIIFPYVIKRISQNNKSYNKYIYEN